MKTIVTFYSRDCTYVCWSSKCPNSRACLGGVKRFLSQVIEDVLPKENGGQKVVRVVQLVLALNKARYRLLTAPEHYLKQTLIRALSQEFSTPGNRWLSSKSISQAAEWIFGHVLSFQLSVCWHGHISRACTAVRKLYRFAATCTIRPRIQTLQADGSRSGLQSRSTNQAISSNILDIEYPVVCTWSRLPCAGYSA